MYWGQGSTLGVLTIVGYLLFVLGAALIWRGRDEVYDWIHDEACFARRSFSRYTVIGPFYGPRAWIRASKLSPPILSVRFAAFPATPLPAA